MKVDELLPEDVVHRGDIRCMRPEGVMHGRESDVLLLALEGREHHVRGVERVNEVRREGRVLLLLVHGLVVEALGHRQGLNNGRDDILLALRFVRLHTREPKGSDPLDRLTGASYHLGALGEPLLDVVGVAEQVTDALNSDLSEVLRRLVKLSIGLIQPFVLELSLYLLTRTDEGDTVHGGHDRLLDDLSGHIALESLGHLDQRSVSLVLNLCDNQLQDGGVDVTGALRVGQVDLASTSIVATQGRVMLHTVT